MIVWLLLLGIAFIAVMCGLALRGPGGGGRFCIVPPGRKGRPDPAHRQAIHHFASGVLPPWH
ncbi:MAG TPA: hypothetical protein VET89_04515 [Stellaceae bacterium]|nr:hypothetical protein [Stellaceae bacterium]